MNITEQNIEYLSECGFLGDGNEDFRKFVESMPAKHWSKYDLSAIRLGWEAYRLLSTDAAKR